MRKWNDEKIISFKDVRTSLPEDFRVLFVNNGEMAISKIK